MKRLLLLLLALVLLSVTVLAGSGTEKVLIRTPKPYDKVVAAIRSAGGTVTYQYKYANGIAAEIPVGAMPKIRALVGGDAMTKDEVVQLPNGTPSLMNKAVPGYSASPVDIQYDSYQPISPEKFSEIPNAYLLNNSMTDVDQLSAYGEGVLVAIIDSGLRPGFPHISGTVIGGEDFVNDGLGYSNFANGGHGTFVTGMIASHVMFLFSSNSSLAKAVAAYAPDSIYQDYPALGYSAIPMIGSAPAASAFHLRVFGPTGGASTSTIMAAADRAIELREMYNNGIPGGQNILVCNMSLGGATLFAGGTTWDELIVAMLEKDIVPVVAAGNAGPSSLTVGQPGTSFGAITVGAANVAANERILRDIQYGPGIGAFYRPFDGTQIAYFSSRGPDANGNRDPDVVANGFASFGMGLGPTTGSISIGSGTSFATPTTSGVAAVLRGMFPSASAKQIRNAIIATATPGMLADGSTYIDMGKGFINAKAAADYLATGTVPNNLVVTLKPKPDVKVNVEQNTFLKTYDGVVSLNTGSLLPGQRKDILYRVLPNTSKLIIGITGIKPALPPSQQNLLFGDDLFVAVHSAKTSSIGEGDYKFQAFTAVDNSFTIENPETGLMRITLSGDWTNAGTISANVGIVALTTPVPGQTTQGKLEMGKQVLIPVTIPAGVQQADFRLSFRLDWSNYPTSDIDMILIDPNNNLYLNGATLNDPEQALIANPTPGVWYVLIDGYAIYNSFDKYDLRVALDGKVVH